jgi:hypothetical protein
VNAIDDIKRREPRFREFGVLEKYYREKIDLDENDLAQLLSITGEAGNSCAERLGAEADTPVAKLLPLAARREAYWRGKSVDYCTSEDMKEVGRLLAQSYGEIHWRLLEAAEHLNAAADLLAYDL